MPTLDPGRPATRWTLAVLFLVPVLFLLTLKSHRTWAMDGDEPHYVLIAESLLQDGDLRMENQYPDPHPYLPQSSSPHCVRAPDGSLYPHHDIGMAVFLMPTLFLVHQVVPRVPAAWIAAARMGDAFKVTVLLFCLQSMIVTGVLALLLFRYFRDQGIDPRAARYGALLAVLSAPIVTHGYLVYTELYSATLLVVLLLLMHRGRSRPANVVWFSLALFVLSWLHVKNFPLCGVLALFWLLDRRSEGGRRPAAARMAFGGTAVLPALALLLTIVLRMLLHWHYLGTVDLFAERVPGSRGLSLAVAPFSLLFNFLDREYGLLFASPVFLLLPLALAIEWRVHRAWYRREGWLVLVYVLGLLPTRDGWAGWSPAARNLLPVVPLLWVPVVRVLALGVPRWRLLWVPVALWAVVTACLWQNPQWAWMSGDGTNRWMRALAPGPFDWQRWLPTFTASDGAFLACSLAWLAAIGVASAWGFRVLTRGRGDGAGVPSGAVAGARGRTDGGRGAPG